MRRFLLLKSEDTSHSEETERLRRPTMTRGGASRHEGAGASPNPLGPLFTRYARTKAIWRRCLDWLTANKERSHAFRDMLYDAYDKSIWVNARAAVFTWILLGGFLSILPALPKFQQSSAVESAVGDGVVLHTIRSASALYYVGAVLLVAGALGIFYMWRKEWREEKENFIWVKDRLF